MLGVYKVIVKVYGFIVCVYKFKRNISNMKGK